MNRLKLDIGSGGKSSDESFIGVDPYVESADVQAFMWELPYEDNSVDVIYSSNALEHISKFWVIPTLKEWLRVLKPGGRAQIIVPDFEWACEWWLHHQTTDWDMDIIYGNQKHPGEFHQTGFTIRIMRGYLTSFEGFKIHKIEKRGGMYSQQGIIEQGTINVELEKL